MKVNWKKGLPPVPGFYWMYRGFGTDYETFGFGLVQYHEHWYLVGDPSTKEPPPLIVRSFIVIRDKYFQPGNGLALSSGSSRDDWMHFEWPITFPGLIGQVKSIELPGPPKPPSKREIVAGKKKREEQNRKNEEERRNAKVLQKRRWDAAILSKTTYYWCSSCEELHEKEALGKLRECSNGSCGSDFFQGPDDERNCPDCNRPFTRIEEEDVCPNCQKADDVELVLDHGKIVKKPQELSD